MTAFTLRDWPDARVFTLAALFLVLGMALTLLAVQIGSVAVAIPATVEAGVGFGAAALACFGQLTRMAAPAERGALFAVAFVISYFAFSPPAVAAGVAITSIGLHTCTVIYSLVVAALGALALLRTRGQSITGAQLEPPAKVG